MSSLIGVLRSVRERLSVPLLAMMLAAVLLCGSLVGSAFGASPAKLISEALRDAKKADKDATKAQASAKTADVDATNSTVGAAHILDGAVTSTKLAAGAVGSGQLAAGAVGGGALADGAVTASKLAAGSVGSAQIAAGSVTIQHFSGTSENTTFSLPAIGANTCSTAEIADPGAAVTDFPMVSFPGPTNLPIEVSATPERVDTVGSVRVKFCNASTTSAAAVSGVNAEVITLR
jgi:hypothetical protein